MRPLKIPTLLLAACLCAHGQTAPVEFEVASVKPSPPPGDHGITVGCKGGPGASDPGAVDCQNVTLTELIGMAYKVNRFQFNPPDWMEAARFDVLARVPHGAVQDQMPEMWRQLLASRFRLQVHWETKEVPLFELRVAKGGPKLTPASDEPPKDPEEPRPHTNKVDADGFPILSRPGMIGMDGHVRLYQLKMTMARLAYIITGQIGRPVVDRTGLDGAYDIQLFWVRDGVPGFGPTMLQAVQAQLGLRLEASRGPIEFLLLDHIEKLPVEN